MTSPVNFRVTPVPLPRVRDHHLRGVFGNFDEVIAARIGELRATRNPLNAERARFFEFLLTQVDAEDYGRIQDHFLDPGAIDPDSNIVKYIDPTIWFESKLDLARRLNLHSLPPIRILDIGTGPGHFPLVARFYGHDATGTDLPPRTTGSATDGHLYDALCHIYRIRRIPLVIRRLEELPDLNGPYDLVTAFLAAFNVDKSKLPWDIAAWRFFLRSVKERVLTESGELFMSLDDSKLTEPVWRYLSERAAFSHDVSKQIRIKDFTPFFDPQEPSC